MGKIKNWSKVGSSGGTEKWVNDETGDTVVVKKLGSRLWTAQFPFEYETAAGTMKQYSYEWDTKKNVKKNAIKWMKENPSPPYEKLDTAY